MANKPINEMSLGELLAWKRDRDNLTDADIARSTGFSATYVGNLLRDSSPTAKNGKPSRLPAPTVDKFARALGLPIATVRQAAGLAPPTQAKPQEAIEGSVMRAMFYEIGDEFASLSPEEQADYEHDFRLMGQALLEIIRTKKRKKKKP